MTSHIRGRGAIVVGVVIVVGAAVSSCGARSELSATDDGPPLDGGVILGCLSDLDCGLPDACAPVHCISNACVASPPVVCDDGDPCTTDSCLPESGACDFVPRTSDADGDGHRAPLPGFAPGAPGSCGDDCNDSSAAAYPGAKEVCDGLDNDCNGIVDDGATYVPSNAPPLLLSAGATQANVGGIAFSTSTFGVAFADEQTSWKDTFGSFSPTEGVVVPATAITHENTDAFTGPIVWTGRDFGMAWEDRRDMDYEIYFNRVDANANKLAPDLRVTDAPRFSLRPDMVWDGTNYTIVWDDTREDDTGVIFGQLVDGDGKLVGQNVPLTVVGEDADSPHIAKGVTELGIVFNETGAGGRALAFRTVSPDLTKLGAEVVLGGGDAASSAIAWSGDRYVIVWDTEGASPGTTIQGAAVSATGEILVPARDVTAPAAFARSEAIAPLGDRLTLVWAEYGKWRLRPLHEDARRESRRALRGSPGDDRPLRLARARDRARGAGWSRHRLRRSPHG